MLVVVGQLHALDTRSPTIQCVASHQLAAKYEGILTPDRLRELQEGLERLHVRLSSNHGRLQIDISQEHSDFIQSFYSNVLARTENAGHEFGKDLSEREKQALIAFLATL
jgi:hypothetical protein